MRAHVSFQIGIDFKFRSANVALEWRVARVRPEMDDQLTRVSRRVRTDHALKRPVVRVSPHMFLHGAAFATGVVTKLAAKGFVSRVNALMDFQFVDAIKRLFTFAANERFFAGVNQQMSLQVFGVLCHVVASFGGEVKRGAVTR